VENANGSGQGNDAAFDDLTLWDATPSLDKSFSPTTIPVGGVSTMTITVTNTSDLAAKDGWSFTDAFPAGLSVADPANASTTCASPTYAPVAGSTSISITANLDAGETFCTISVDVTASTNGTFRNGASNMGTNLGLKLPTTPATLTVGTGLPATGGGMGALPYGLVLLGLGSTAVVVSRSRRSLPASQR
jgi:uncharacterized repeat protein (TIGR01451 family)